jgi:hypothetical protein
MFHRIQFYLYSLFFFSWPGFLLADNQNATGFGEVANNLNQTVLTPVKDIMQGTGYILGAALLLVSIHKFQRYRQNPQETPFFTVLVYFFLGLLLIAITFAPRLAAIYNDNFLWSK